MRVAQSLSTRNAKHIEHWTQARVARGGGRGVLRNTSAHVLRNKLSGGRGRAAREARRHAEFGVRAVGGADSSFEVDFGAVMERMRRLRAAIAPADAHVATTAVGADVYSLPSLPSFLRP